MSDGELCRKWLLRVMVGSWLCRGGMNCASLRRRSDGVAYTRVEILRQESYNSISL